MCRDSNNTWCAFHPPTQDKVLSACERLLQHAPAIKQTVDLAGASIAIDDCYELWESGFISIPYDFEISELQPQLQKLLAAGNARAAATNSHGDTAPPEGGATATAAAAGMSGEGSSDEDREAEVVVAMEGVEFDMEQEDGYITAASRRQGVRLEFPHAYSCCFMSICYV